MLTQVYLQFCDNIRCALRKDNLLIEYTELDYSNIVLDKLFCLFQNKQIDEMIVIPPGVFAAKIYQRSISQMRFKTLSGTRFYCVSIELLDQIAHLAKVVNCKRCYFVTLPDCFCAYRDNACFVYSTGGAIEVYAIKAGKLIEGTCCTQAMLQSTLQNICVQTGITEIVNVDTLNDLDLLNDFLENSYMVLDEKAYHGLSILALGSFVKNLKMPQEFMQAKWRNDNIGVAALDEIQEIDEKADNRRSNRGHVDAKNPTGSAQAVKNKKSVKIAQKTKELSKPTKSTKPAKFARPTVSADEPSVVKKAVTAEQHKNKMSELRSLCVIFIAIVFIIFTVFSVRLKQHNDQEYTAAMASNSALRDQLSEVQNKVALLQTVTTSDGSTAIFDTINTLLKDKKAGCKINKVTFSQGNIILSMYFKGDKAYDSFYSKLEQNYTVISDTQTEITEKGQYREIIIASPA